MEERTKRRVVTMNIPRFRRRKFIIKPAYQLKACLMVLIYFVIYSIMLGFIIFYPLNSELNSAISIEDQARIADITLQLHKTIWPAIFIVGILVILHVIFYTHRSAGPMFKFEKMFDELLKGDFGLRMRLRKRDDFKELESVFNWMAEYLEETRTRETDFHEALQSKLDNVATKLIADGELVRKDVITQ
jgi:methyl-accepting chemotaxis protein